MTSNSFLFVFFLILFVIIFSVNSAYSSEQKIPVWIKKITSWWSDERISDLEFKNFIEYLYQKNILLDSNSQEFSELSLGEIKLVAKNWSEDMISDEEFLKKIPVLKKFKIYTEIIIQKEPLESNRWVEWNDTISWDYFQILGPLDKQSSVYTATQLETDYKVRTIEGENCRFEFESINGRAYFDKQNSWASKSMRSDYLLLHEKNHFDLAQIHALILNSELRQLEQKQFSCAENTLNVSYEELVRYSADAFVRQILDPIISQLVLMDQRYDVETNFGRDFEKQKEWDQMIEQMFN